MKKTSSPTEYKYPPADQLQGKWSSLVQQKDAIPSPETGLVFFKFYKLMDNCERKTSPTKYEKTHFIM